jgi:hypothetical protein
MVYCELAGVNCFWIRNDLIKNNLGLNTNLLQSILTPQFLYKQPRFIYEDTNKDWVHVSC